MGESRPVGRIPEWGKYGQFGPRLVFLELTPLMAGSYPEKKGLF